MSSACEMGWWTYTGLAFRMCLALLLTNGYGLGKQGRWAYSVSIGVKTSFDLGFFYGIPFCSVVACSNACCKILISDRACVFFGT